MTPRHSFYLFMLERLGTLPFRGRRFLGCSLGAVAQFFCRKQRDIVARNLRGAFPQMSEKERKKLLRTHFCCLGKSLMDELWALTASSDDLRRYIVVQNEELLTGEEPIIAFVPHFLGLNLSGLRLSEAFPRGPIMFIYRPQTGDFWNFVLSRLRGRFGNLGVDKSENSSLRQCVRHLKGGGMLYYASDMNAKRLHKSTAFAPFLGVPQAATYTAIGRLAKITGARVLPCLISMTDSGYQIRINPPLAHLADAGKQVIAETINDVVGEHVQRVPAQYYWLHRRFQTRPEGEEGFYV